MPIRHRTHVRARMHARNYNCNCLHEYFPWLWWLLLTTVPAANVQCCSAFPGSFLLGTGAEDYPESAYYFNAGPYRGPTSGLTVMGTCLETLATANRLSDSFRSSLVKFRFLRRQSGHGNCIFCVLYFLRNREAKRERVTRLVLQATRSRSILLQ
jgi:hypothetical protein